MKQLKRLLLIPLHRARYRNQRLTEQLAAERAVNGELNRCLDEAMELIEQQSKELEASQALARDQSALLAGFEQMIATQLRPLCHEVLEYTKQEQWRRGEQFSFREDGQ